MPDEVHVCFGPFRIDAPNERLWRGEDPVSLTPKAFAVLRYLVAHPARVVSKGELFQAVWPETTVGDAALTVCIRELRRALGDQAKLPRYIETVHRRGYRFIAPVVSSQYAVVSRAEETRGWRLETRPPTPQASSLKPQASHMAGREAELRQLHRRLEKAQAGERQIVFVTGEAGIGKTALIDAFVAQAAAARDFWLGQGQCIEHFGAGEAYLPVIVALGQVCRGPEGQPFLTCLAQQAPTWVVQVPTLLGREEFETLQRKTAGATRERMLRELAEALEVCTADRFLVLVLEDLHWADYSTLEFLSYLARRRQPARLLVIGTYRPAEVAVQGHPLRDIKQELLTQRLCQELAIRGFAEAEVATYLAVRFPASRLPEALTPVLYRRTEGNPLFLVSVVNDLVSRGVIVQRDGEWKLKDAIEAIEGEVPESLQQFVDRQLGLLSVEEQRLLEAASVAGVEFSAAAVVAGVGIEIKAAEALCAGLARRGQFFQARGIAEWPDGTVASCYRFVHVLYQDIIYARVITGWRVELHQRIGDREEAAYGPRAGEVAAELAMHFERGRDYRRAVQYHGQAGGKALRRSAYQEAIAHLTRGLELLKTQPDTPDRAQQELLLLTTLGPALMAIKGFAASEVEQIYARARELCRQLGETPQLFTVMRGLWMFYIVRAELQTARELAERCFTLAQSTQDPTLLLEAHWQLGQSLFWLGEFTLARTHLERGMSLYDPRQHSSHAFHYGHDPGVGCRAFMAHVLWYLGYPDQALERSREALALAQELAHPFVLAFALDNAAVLHQCRRERHAAQTRAEAALALSTKHGFVIYAALGTVLRGWALAEQGQGEEGISQILQGLTAMRAIGTEAARTYLLALLAEAQGKKRQIEEGLRVLAEALATAQKNEERLEEAELYRLAGELSLRIGEAETEKTGDKEIFSDSPILRFPGSSPEECFQQAIAVARRQSAKSLELRAVMSLARLWQQQGKRDEARQLLAEVYGWFTEGFDTADLQEAQALLEELEEA